MLRWRDAGPNQSCIYWGAQSSKTASPECHAVQSLLGISGASATLPTACVLSLLHEHACRRHSSLPEAEAGCGAPAHSDGGKGLVGTQEKAYGPLGQAQGVADPQRVANEVRSAGAAARLRCWRHQARRGGWGLHWCGCTLSPAVYGLFPPAAPPTCVCCILRAPSSHSKAH